MLYHVLKSQVAELFHLFGYFQSNELQGDYQKIQPNYFIVNF
jgi:hypothetical protein